MTKKIQITIAELRKRVKLAAAEGMSLQEFGAVEQMTIGTDYTLLLEENVPIVERSSPAPRVFSEVELSAYLDAHPSQTYTRNGLLTALGYPLGVRAFSQPLTWVMKGYGATISYGVNTAGGEDTSDATYTFTEKLR